MKNLLQYKGYYGSVEYDSGEPIFYGKIEYVKALVSYEAKDAIGIKKAFHEAVDHYLAMCQKERIEPEKSFKGSFNVRTGHELHCKIALEASKREISINKFICQVLLSACVNKNGKNHYKKEL